MTYRDSIPDFVPFERQKKCDYFDEFDIETYNAGPREKEFMVPTHTTRFFQKTVPCNGTEACEHKYDFSRPLKEAYVADIDSSTLLIDHSYVCEHLHMENDAWSLFGMYRACTECPLMEVPYAPGQKDEWKTEWGHGDELLEKTRKTWDTHIEKPIGSGFVSIRYGDYITLKDLLKLAQVDLDLPVGVAVDRPRSRRETGTVIIIEVTYYNYHESSIPNSLPPVYVYDVFEMPVEKFKATEMVWKDLYDEAPSRTIVEVHGIHVALRVKGVLGRFSLTSTLLMIIEIGVLLGLISWFTQMCALNWYGGTLGDAFDDALVEEIREEAATEYDAKAHVGRLPWFCCSFIDTIHDALGLGRKTLVHIPLVGDAVSINAEEKLILLEEKPGWSTFDSDIGHMRSLFVGPFRKLHRFPKCGGHSQYGAWDPEDGTTDKTTILRYCVDKKEFQCVDIEHSTEKALTLTELGLTMREEHRGDEHEHGGGTTFSCCDVKVYPDDHHALNESHMLLGSDSENLSADNDSAFTAGRSAKPVAYY